MTADELRIGREVWLCNPAEMIPPQRGKVRSVEGDRALVMTGTGLMSIEGRYCFASRGVMAAALSGLCRTMADYYCGLAGFYKRCSESMGEPKAADHDPGAVFAPATDATRHDLGRVA